MVAKEASSAIRSPTARASDRPHRVAGFNRNGWPTSVGIGGRLASESVADFHRITHEVADKQVLDAAIVGSAQAVEHYEIARYGTLIAWADELGRDDIVRLLTTNLNEEKAADKKLSTVALRKGVNRKAAS